MGLKNKTKPEILKPVSRDAEMVHYKEKLKIKK